MLDEQNYDLRTDDDEVERKTQAEVLLNTYSRDLERRRLSAGARGLLLSDAGNEFLVGYSPSIRKGSRLQRQMTIKKTMMVALMNSTILNPLRPELPDQLPDPLALRTI